MTLYTQEELDQAAREENEACVKVCGKICDDQSNYNQYKTAEECADKIRKRMNKIQIDPKELGLGEV